MRIPFGTPTVSDATKLGVRTGFDGPFAGVQLYQLLYLPVITELFNDLSAWDVTDSSGSNIAVSGNVLSMNGSNAFNANGIVLHAGITAAEGVLEYEFKNSVKNSGEVCGLAASATLTYLHVHTPHYYISNIDNAFQLRISTTAFGTLPRTYDVWYKVRVYLLKTADGSLKRAALTVQGGTEYVNETEIGCVTMVAAMSGTIYPQFQRYINNVKALSYIRNVYWKAGFATDGPTLTYVADAGAGKTFGGFVPTNLAAVGSWATTNALFKYSYDDGTPAYNASWLTLAQLNAETALTTSKRYIRIQVQVNSDGATQQYAGEINADDATAMPAAKDLTYAEEADRNTIPTLSLIPTPATGGPAAWKQLNVERVGTLDLNAVKTAYEEARNNARGTTGADILAPASVLIRNVEIVGTGSAGGDPPPAGSWGAVALTAGDGTLVLSVVATNPTDVIYARYRRFLSTGAWSAESESFKVTGTGVITLTGLANEQYYEVVFCTKSGSLTSAWSEPRYGAPTAGEAAVIDQIMDAIVAEINALGLTSETEAGASVAVTAVKEIPPDFDSEVNTPVIKVFPDTEEGEASHNDLNEIRPRVNVVLCQRAKTAAQQARLLRVRERLRDQFLGKRLVGMSDQYCERETESGVLDLDSLWERFHWFSPITFEYVALRAQG